MKYLFIFLSTILCNKSSSGQLKFNIKSFNEKFEIVQWLCLYDQVAWRTSDSVLASPKSERDQLGQEWFCFREDKIWHAAYGGYKNGKYNLIFHYILDTTWKIKRVSMPVDTFLLNSYSRALSNAGKKLKRLKDTVNIRLNQYIKRNEDSSLSIWILPAFSSDGLAIYGGEFYYKYDAAGNNLLDKAEYFKGSFRGFKTDKIREIWLGYKDVDEPTLGSIFFVWYYKTFFTNIYIENKYSKSTASYNKDKREYYWTHYSNHK